MHSPTNGSLCDVYTFAKNIAETVCADAEPRTQIVTSLIWARNFAFLVWPMVWPQPNRVSVMSESTSTHTFPERGFKNVYVVIWELTDTFPSVKLNG